MDKSIICPTCKQVITDSGREFGVDFRMRCIQCSCGTRVIVNNEEPEVLIQKLKALRRK